MNCSCGGNTEYTHKVQRDNKIVGEYQKCPACGRILWLWKSKSINKADKPTGNSHLETIRGMI